MVIAADTEKSPEGRRERILRAAVDVIRDRGFAGTRVSDIAQLAGTSQGLVLYHFGSLAEALHQSIVLLEDEFYAELEVDLRNAVGPVDRLRHMAEMASGFGPAVGDWRLWLELWVRALHDDDARRARESLDRRWRAALNSVISEGVATGDFTTTSATRSSLRLAALMDGLAIQLALEDPGMTPRRFTDLWWEAAVLELGITVPRRPRRR
jgi:TetR/AcrR family transcriptional repressor of bet genes